MRVSVSSILTRMCRGGRPPPPTAISTVDAERSLWDVCFGIGDANRAFLLEQVFESVALSGDGVVDFTLKPLWIRGVLHLNAA